MNTWGLTVDAEMRRMAGWTLAAGLDAFHDRVGSWRRDDDQTSGLVTSRRGLYPDGAGALAVAAFLIGSWSRGGVHLDLGGRYSHSTVRARDASFGVIAVSPGAVVGSIGGSYDVSPGLELVGSPAQSFRAPNIDDLSTLGAFDYGVEVPSPDLSPERAVAVEGGLRARIGPAGVSATFYRTSLRDLIDRVRSSYLGESMLEGQMVYRKANVARAFVRGAEVEAEVHLTASLRAAAHATYTYGQQSSLGQPMRRIPPLNGAVSLRWERPDRGWIEGRLRVAGAQRRLAPGDLADHRIAKGGTDGWAVLDIEGGRRLAAHLRVTAGVSNVFNEAYRIHGSGIDGVGRSAWLVARVGF